MSTRLFTVAFAAAASMTLYAQAPQTATTPQSPDRPNPTATQVPNRATQAPATVTISGCLKEEKPGAAAAAVPLTVLTDVKMSPSSSVSGIGVSTKYQIEGLADAELKKHHNHQVELTGQIAPPKADAAADDSPNFKATSLKMLAATCTAQ